MPIPRLFGELIAEQCSTLGTDPYELDGPLEGYRAFSEDFGDTDTPYYAVKNRDETKYEYHRGAVTFTIGTPCILTRSVWLSSEAGNGEVPWTTDDLPLIVYQPTSGELLEAMVRGWLHTTRNAMLSFGLWFKQDGGGADLHQWMIFDGTEDIEIGTVDAVNHTIDFYAWPPALTLDYDGVDGIAPRGTLFQRGQAVSRTTYSRLFNKITQDMGTVTISIASPAVVSKTAHGRKLGEKVSFNTTSALPTGLAVGTNYYVSSVPNADTFQVSTTRGGASLNTSGSQSGVHSCRLNPHGCGDGTTTFNVPDKRNVMTIGRDTDTSARGLVTFAGSGVYATVQGDVAGSQFMQSHGHGYSDPGHGHGYSDPGHAHNLTQGGSGPTSYTSRAAFGDGINAGNYGGVVNSAPIGISIAAAVTSITISSNGSGTSQNMPPLQVVEKVITTGGQG